MDNLSSNVVAPETYRDSCDVRICSVDQVDSLGPPYDEIYHLASLVGPVRILNKPQLYRETLACTEAIVAMASRHASRLVYVSSSDTYGRAGPLSESDAPASWRRHTPRADYAAAKLASERLIGQACCDLGLEAVIVRPFNVAGPRQDPSGGFVVARFVAAVLAGEPLTVYGTGLQRRTFLHVREAASGLVAAARRIDSGEIVNLGNPETLTTIRDLAASIQRYHRGPSSIVSVCPKELFGRAFDDGFEKIPVISKLQAVGWNPSLSLEAIVRDTYNDCHLATENARDVANAG